MGNMHCPPEDAAHLASVARDICPFPIYNPSPLFAKMLPMNSSLQLREHYRAVQSSLSPNQLEDFTQSLKTTFGGVGVVALSLAVLFDTLARQAKGEWVTDPGPIPGLFIKDQRGYYPPHVYTVSEHLKLVPHIANNPTRMIEETERYLKLFAIDYNTYVQLGENQTLPMNEDTTEINIMLGNFVGFTLHYHLQHIQNVSVDMVVLHERTLEPDDITFNLNCDPEAADKEFLAEVQKSDNRTQEAFESCKPQKGNTPNTWLQHVAKLELLDVLFIPTLVLKDYDFGKRNTMRKDFDLKANALGKCV